MTRERSLVAEGTNRAPGKARVMPEAAKERLTSITCHDYGLRSLLMLSLLLRSLSHR
jgi:hypothetical protein